MDGLVDGQGGGEETVKIAGTGDLGDVGLHGGAVTAGADALQAGRKLGELTGGLDGGLVEDAEMTGVQGVGVGEKQTTTGK